MKSGLVVLAGWLLFSTLGAQAQALFEISPQYGYRFGGGFETPDGLEVGIEDGRAYGLFLDYSPDRNADFSFELGDDSTVKLELLWSRQESGFDLHGAGGANHVGLTVDEFQIGGVLETAYGRFHPYITGLMGATLFGPQGYDSEVRFSLSVGGGIKFFLFRNLALRADVRGFCTLVDSESAFISSGGVTVVRFSGSTIWQGEVSGGLTLAF